MTVIVDSNKPLDPDRFRDNTIGELCTYIGRTAALEDDGTWRRWRCSLPAGHIPSFAHRTEPKMESGNQALAQQAALLAAQHEFEESLMGTLTEMAGSFMDLSRDLEWASGTANKLATIAFNDLKAEIQEDWAVIVGLPDATWARHQVSMPKGSTPYDVTAHVSASWPDTYEFILPVGLWVE